MFPQDHPVDNDDTAREANGGIGRTGVMKHLDVLQAASLVIVRREGARWNHVKPDAIQRVCDRWVSRHVGELARSAKRLKDLAAS